MFAVGGPAFVLAYLLATRYDEETDLRMLLFFFPPFQLPAASVRAASLEKEIAACNYLRNTDLTDSDDSDSNNWTTTNPANTAALSADDFPNRTDLADETNTV
ncbi:hypothetical protein MRX96_011973 [Rhipicephalus microplus]